MLLRLQHIGQGLWARDKKTKRINTPAHPNLELWSRWGGRPLHGPTLGAQQLSVAASRSPSIPAHRLAERNIHSRRCSCSAPRPAAS